jgi:pimeloyl-ACP methyl ester carboxylesterase
MATSTDGTAANGPVSLATRDYGGDGPDLLFIPGGGQTLVDCDVLAPYLTTSFRVAAMDVRGHGLSDDAPFTWDAVLDDVDAVIAALGMQDAAVVGHSLGGMIAALHGARNPNALGVVNVDGHGSGRPHQFDGVPREVVEARQVEQKALVEAQLAALRESGAGVLPAEAVEAMATQFCAAYGLSEDIARQIAARSLVAVDGGFRRRMVVDGHLQILDEVERLDFEAMYRACKAPLLVYNAVRAQEPPPGAPEWMHEHMAAYRRGLSLQLAALAEELPHLSWIEIDATHALVYEQPELIATQLKDFLLG